MKKILYSIMVLITATVVMSSCSTTKNATTASLGRSKVTGTWTVNSISYDGIVENAVQSLFDQGPANVFQGSTWILTNSGKGNYSLTNGTVQPIFWAMNNNAGNSEFSFKKLNDGDKAKKVDSGYRMFVSSSDKNTLTLKAPVKYSGTTGYIVFNMVKK